MYNYSINTTYLTLPDLQQDTVYRKELLSVFNLKSYNDITIANMINHLYDKYKNNSQLKELLKLDINSIPIKLNEQTKFTFLFSFETFFYTHKCLQNLNHNNIINTQNYIKLKNILQKK